jgi:hypothetical protein
MSSTRLFAAAGLFAWLTATVLGQEPASPPAPASPPPASRGAAPPAPPPGAGQRGGASPAAPPADGSQPSQASEDEFIPTEELAPDAAVTFPVDI